MPALSFPSAVECGKRFPRVTACLIRTAYLTEWEAAAVVRDYLRTRSGFHALTASHWTPLERSEFSALLSSERHRTDGYKRHNRAIVHAYFSKL